MKKYRISIIMLVFVMILAAGCGRGATPAASGANGPGHEDTGAPVTGTADADVAGTVTAEEPVPGTVEISTGDAETGSAAGGSGSGTGGEDSAGVGPGFGTPAVEPGASEEMVTARFEILEVREESLLVLGLDDTKGLYRVGHGTVFEDADGSALSLSDLRETEIVELTWDGMVKETYPGQFDYNSLKKTGEMGNSSFPFYRKLLKDLAATDPGLNEGITQGFFDLTDVASLSDGEKEGLAYLAGGDYGVMGTQSTAEKLKEEGILDGVKGLESGILVTVEETSYKEGKITCNADKYRSGTGAYYFRDVKAKYKNGEWEYKIGEQMIS